MLPRRWVPSAARYLLSSDGATIGFTRTRELRPAFAAAARRGHKDRVGGVLHRIPAQAVQQVVAQSWPVAKRASSARTAAPPIAAGRASATPAASGIRLPRRVPLPHRPVCRARGGCLPLSRWLGPSTRRHGPPQGWPSQSPSPAEASWLE